MAARYDAVADFYVADVGDRVDDPATAALLELAGLQEGAEVVDIACGHGRVSRAAARRGASVFGVDLSERLLAAAEAAEREEPLGIRYANVDVTSPDVLRHAAFDVVLCNFGLSDIDDLDGALATVSRSLRPAGSFVFSILHPCFPGWGDRAASAWPTGDGYFHEGWWRPTTAGSALRRRVGANHRTIGTYVNAVLGHGLPVEEIVELPPPAAWLRAEADRDPVPTFLVVRCRRADAAPGTPVRPAS